ncbi:MAG: hypothetical protein ACR2K3_04300 [Nocardioides sp.]
MAVIVSGLVVPGLGIVLALVLALTRLRNASPAARWGLVGLGIIVLALQLVGLLTGAGPSGGVGPASPVH